MSIFRNTFTTAVQDQLRTRQDAIENRTPQTIQLLNNRSSWVRMTSGVDVYNPKTQKNDNALAKQYVLLGGVLDNRKPKAGVGNTGNEAYSGQTPAGNPYTRGIRPMPGITSVDIKSKSAYGSLREVTVNFVCNSIEQLEDLEILYMRPGYTVLVEWGWIPYLDNTKKLVSNVDFYDDVLNGGKDFPTILSELFKKSQTLSGNYEGLYGYVKNYNWTARMDGGYDCQTTIISVGEILESLKVNNTSFNVAEIATNGGLLIGGRGITSASPSLTKFTSPDFSANPSLSPVPNVQSFKPISAANLKDYYSQNMLAGLLYEMKQVITDTLNSSGKKYTVSYLEDRRKNNDKYYFFGMYYDTISKSTSTSTIKPYITLESLVSLINNYIIIGAGTDAKNLAPFIKLSTKPNSYDPVTETDSLLCLAHPLQVSVDVDTCIITNSLFANGFNIKVKGVNAGAKNGSPSSQYVSDVKSVIGDLKYATTPGVDFDTSFKRKQKAANSILNSLGAKSTNEFAGENAKQYLIAFADELRLQEKNPNLSNSEIVSRLEVLKSFINGSNSTTIASVSSSLFNVEVLNQADTDKANATKAKQDLAEGKPSPFKFVQYLNVLENQSGTNGKKFQYKDELGKIGNIYLNIDKLLSIVTNTNNNTNNTKKELKLYDFIKNVMQLVQESTGNVNNFDIHVDPIDSVARIIDINYVDTKNRTDAYNNAFKIEVANTSGTVRSYNLQSQIFPEQASMVAIGAQVKAGGEQGSKNSTLIDFNNGLTDRIIPVKLDQTFPISTETPENKSQKLIDNIVILQDYFFKDESTAAKGASADVDVSNKYKNALKDTITYVQGVTKSNTKNRSLIPVKLSLTMDGIGGLIIGHLFKFPDELLPKGYKFDNNVGVKLLQAVTGISHKIDNNIWTTTIDAYNMVLNDPKGDVDWNSLLKSTPSGTLIEIPSSNKPNTAYPEKGEVPYKPTSIPKYQLAEYLKAKVRFGLNKNVAIAVMAKSINEQGSGADLKGFNNNFYGVQTDGSRWPAQYDSVILSNVYTTESATGKTRAFAAFATPTSGADFVIDNVQRRGIYVGGTTTLVTKGTYVSDSTMWAKTYYREWVTGNAQAEPDKTTLNNLISIYNTATKFIG